MKTLLVTATQNAAQLAVTSALRARVVPTCSGGLEKSRRPSNLQRTRDNFAGSACPPVQS
jgi:hypothetical protein